MSSEFDSVFDSYDISDAMHAVLKYEREEREKKERKNKIYTLGKILFKIELNDFINNFILFRCYKYL